MTWIAHKCLLKGWDASAWLAESPDKEMSGLEKEESKLSQRQFWGFASRPFACTMLRRVDAVAAR